MAKLLQILQTPLVELIEKIQKRKKTQMSGQVLLGYCLQLSRLLPYPRVSFIII
jgi:hypothetical protein